MSREAYPEPYAVVKSELQLVWTHEMQAWLGVVVLVEHANFVAAPLLPLLELHAIADATHTSASAVKPRNPIMKGPPE